MVKELHVQDGSDATAGGGKWIMGGVDRGRTIDRGKGTLLRVYSPLKRAPPSPPRMIAFMNDMNRPEYSGGGTGLILCCKTTVVRGYV